MHYTQIHTEIKWTLSEKVPGKAVSITSSTGELQLAQAITMDIAQKLLNDFPDLVMVLGLR